MKPKSLSLWAVMVFSLLSIMSCNEVPGDLIGKWCNEQEGEIDFNEDLTCVVIDSQGQETQGTYRVSGDKVTIEKEDAQGTLTYTFEIAGETLILTDADGNANTFTKCESTEPTTTTTISAEPTTTTTAEGSEIIFSYFDGHDTPSGVTGDVDNSLHKMKVEGTAKPSSSRYVYFSPAPIPLSNLKTSIFEADISLPTGLRTGILDSQDPCGDQSDNSMGTPVLFRVEFTPFTFTEISMQGIFGLQLEQVINSAQPQDELSINGRPARVGTLISNWTGGPASFDPLGLISEGSVEAKFRARLSIDFEKNMVKAEIIPDPTLAEKFNPLPSGSAGAIAVPFLAVTDLIDYTKDPNFDGALEYKIYVRTNGNTDVDNSSAPGGTLRYIKREFANVNIYFDQPIYFPVVPQIIFPADDFNNGVISPSWQLFTPSDLNFEETDNLLKLTGNPEVTDAAFFISTDAPRQDVTVGIDFRAPTGIQNNTPCRFRIQFDFFNYVEIEIDDNGYKFLRWIEGDGGATGNSLPLFGDETKNFHRLKLSYTDDTGHIDAFVDDIQLNGIDDKIIASSFANFQFAFFSHCVKGQYIEREWDSFDSK